MYTEGTKLAQPNCLVPMEEVVRAFNWVIEKGLVCRLTRKITVKYSRYSRHSTGQRQNGLHTRLRKRSVSSLVLGSYEYC